MKITKQEILDLKAKRKAINSCNFEDIEPVDFEISDELKRKIKFCGLNTLDLCEIALGVGVGITMITASKEVK